MGISEYTIITWASCGHAEQMQAMAEEEAQIRARMKETPCLDCQTIENLRPVVGSKRSGRGGAPSYRADTPQL